MTTSWRRSGKQAEHCSPPVRAAPCCMCQSHGSASYPLVDGSRPRLAGNLGGCPLCHPSRTWRSRKACATHAVLAPLQSGDPPSNATWPYRPMLDLLPPGALRELDWS